MILNYKILNTNQKKHRIFFPVLSWGQLHPGEMSYTNWAIVSYTAVVSKENLTNCK